MSAVANIENVTATHGVWLVAVRCPFCRKQHHHGGGPTAGRLTLGHRAAHCDEDDSDGYFLSFDDDGPDLNP